MRRVVLSLLFSLLLISSALSHHDWEWDFDKEIELTGIIDNVEFGGEHPLMTLRVPASNGLALVLETWTIALSTGYYLDKAGLSKESLVGGTEVTVRGAPAMGTYDSQSRMLAKYLTIGRITYKLF